MAAGRLRGQAYSEAFRAITPDLVEMIVREDGMMEREIPRQARNDGQQARNDEGNGLRQVPLTRIVRSRWQPRGVAFDEGALWELARSIEAQGLINPVVVFETEGPNADGSARERYFELVAGERRTRAVLGMAWAGVDKDVSTKQAVETLAACGLGALPDEARDLLAAAGAGILARVEVGESAEDLARLHRVAVVENIERASLTPVEEARAFRGLMEAYDWSQRELARHIGKSQGFVAQRVGLLGLAEEAQEAVSTRVITLTHARAIGQVSEAMQPALTEWVTREVSKADTPATTRQVQNVARDVAAFLDPARWEPAEGEILKPRVRNRLALMRWALGQADLERAGAEVIKLRRHDFKGNLLAIQPVRLAASNSLLTVLEALGVKVRKGRPVWERFAEETGRRCETCVFGKLERKEALFIHDNCARGTEQKGQGEATTWTCQHFIAPDDPLTIPLGYETAGWFERLEIEVVQEPFPHVRSVMDYVRGAQQAAVLKREQREQAEAARQEAHLVGMRAFFEWQLEQPDEDLRHFQAHACHKCVEYRPELIERELPPCRLAVEPLKARYGSDPRAPEFGVLVAQEGRLLPRCERFRYAEVPAILGLAGVTFGGHFRRALVWLRNIVSGQGYGHNPRAVLFGVLAWLPAERPEDKGQDWDRLVKWVRVNWEALGGDAAVARLLDVALSEVKARGGYGNWSGFELLDPTTGETSRWCGLDFKYLTGEREVGQWMKWPEGWARPWEKEDIGD